MEEFARAALLFGEDGIARLAAARVAVFGVGGVGGYVCEALARSGVGALDLFDDDRVALSNINRQIIALHSTVGQYKVDAMAARIRDINPAAQVGAYRRFFTPENAGEIDFSKYDYVVDAIDTVTAKIELVMRCRAAGVPIICAMGAGNKLDPSRFEVADLSKTSVCPLARVMRQELKKRGVRGVKAVYSREEPVKPQGRPAEAMPDTPQRTGAARRATPGSTAFAPPVAGLLLASEVVRDLTGV